MIRVMACDASGAVACGGEELLGREPAAGGTLWVDLEGQDASFAALLGGWGFHPLAIEDTFTLYHQPKVEEYGDTVFAIVRGIDFNEPEGASTDDVRTLKLACFLSPGRLVTVHRAPMRSVAAVRRKVEENGRALPGGAAQLLWSICDEMMDLYFPVVDEIGEAIEALEARVVADAREAHLTGLLGLRRRLATLRRTMIPHRQVFTHLANARGGAIDDTAGLNFRDTLDNVLRLADAIDQQRDLLTNVKDTYLSVVAQRTNDIMRVLTVFSAIILPLSLVASIYGMNFQHMPELERPWGYPAVLAGMAALAGGMLLWFRKKRWL